MPQWLGTHMKETVSVLELKVVRRVKIRVDGVREIRVRNGVLCGEGVGDN